jgi:hypothetical protein
MIDLSALIMNEEAENCVREVKGRYKRGLPALAPTREERPLKASEMVNRDLDLGAMQHPVMLTLMASRDPFVSTALAASSRLMWDAADREIIAGLAGMIGQISQHEDVRTTADVAARYHFDPEFVQEIGVIAVNRVPEEQDRAMNALSDLLRSVRQLREAPKDFILRLLRLGYACNLSRDTFERLLMSMIRSPDLGPRIRVSVSDNLHLFPRHLLIAVAMEVSRLPGRADCEMLKRELERVLINTPRNFNPWVNGAPSRSGNGYSNGRSPYHA